MSSKPSSIKFLSERHLVVFREERDTQCFLPFCNKQSTENLEKNIKTAPKLLELFLLRFKTHQKKNHRSVVTLRQTHICKGRCLNNCMSKQLALQCLRTVKYFIIVMQSPSTCNSCKTYASVKRGQYVIFILCQLNSEQEENVGLNSSPY